MMEIEQHLWGMTPEGEAIVLYTMRNAQGAEVKLSNYGAAIVSIVVPDREGRMADVALGYKRPEGYFFDGAASGKTVGRVANRIACGRMTIEGEEYALEVNNGPNHLHGGTKNFANRVWESRVETNRVVMDLLSEDGDRTPARRRRHAAGLHGVPPFPPRHRLGVQPYPRLPGLRPSVRHRGLETRHSGRSRLPARPALGPAGRSADLAARRDDLYGQLARRRMPRNQIGRPAWRSSARTTPTP